MRFSQDILNNFGQAIIVGSYQRKIIESKDEVFGKPQLFIIKVFNYNALTGWFFASGKDFDVVYPEENIPVIGRIDAPVNVTNPRDYLLRFQKFYTPTDTDRKNNPAPYNIISQSYDIRIVEYVAALPAKNKFPVFIESSKYNVLNSKCEGIWVAYVVNNIKDMNLKIDELKEKQDI